MVGYSSSQTLQKANMTAAASKQKSKGPPVIKASLVWYNKVRQGNAAFKAQSDI
jgi:hypothetical protein